MEHILGRIQSWLQVGVDGISIRDDWGAQDRLLISPGLWREVFKPCYRTICDAIHDGGSNAHLHTDGFTMQIIPDLIEVGFDELNPQLSALEPARLAELTRGKVCLRPDIDRQQLLPRGTPDAVTNHVRGIIEQFGGHEGGLIGCGEIASDVPLENAEAMLKAFYEYGTYSP
jgi:uroporphyrinogen-III decarboxylase